VAAGALRCAPARALLFGSIQAQFPPSERDRDAGALPPRNRQSPSSDIATPCRPSRAEGEARRVGVDAGRLLDFGVLREGRVVRSSPRSRLVACERGVLHARGREFVWRTALASTVPYRLGRDRVLMPAEDATSDRDATADSFRCSMQFRDHRASKSRHPNGRAAS